MHERVRPAELQYSSDFSIRVGPPVATQRLHETLVGAWEERFHAKQVGEIRESAIFGINHPVFSDGLFEKGKTYVGIHMLSARDTDAHHHLEALQTPQSYEVPNPAFSLFTDMDFSSDLAARRWEGVSAETIETLMRDLDVGFMSTSFRQEPSVIPKAPNRILRVEKEGLAVDVNFGPEKIATGLFMKLVNPKAEQANPWSDRFYLPPHAYLRQMLRTYGEVSEAVIRDLYDKHHVPQPDKTLYLPKRIVEKGRLIEEFQIDAA